MKNHSCCVSCFSMVLLTDEEINCDMKRASDAVYFILVLYSRLEHICPSAAASEQRRTRTRTTGSSDVFSVHIEERSLKTDDVIVSMQMYCEQHKIENNRSQLDCSEDKLTLKTSQGKQQVAQTQQSQLILSSDRSFIKRKVEDKRADFYLSASLLLRDLSRGFTASSCGSLRA